MYPNVVVVVVATMRTTTHNEGPKVLLLLLVVVVLVLQFKGPLSLARSQKGVSSFSFLEPKQTALATVILEFSALGALDVD